MKRMNETMQNREWENEHVVKGCIGIKEVSRGPICNTSSTSSSLVENTLMKS